jgi:hypothetical protein
MKQKCRIINRLFALAKEAEKQKRNKTDNSSLNQIYRKKESINEFKK